ncbi:MAG: hypothetical protein HUU50_02555 [Candidatus Brocadiae bacterium]|nr:hypothetical protein [Candidatus Brocadiia bacterium]
MEIKDEKAIHYSTPFSPGSRDAIFHEFLGDIKNTLFSIDNRLKNIEENKNKESIEVKKVEERKPEERFLEEAKKAQEAIESFKPKKYRDKS